MPLYPYPCIYYSITDYVLSSMYSDQQRKGLNYLFTGTRTHGEYVFPKLQTKPPKNLSATPTRQLAVFAMFTKNSNTLLNIARDRFGNFSKFQKTDTPVSGHSPE